MSVGQFVFMLHSHLPYYRKAGMWPFGEENLYECMAETYVPLINAISELYDEGIKAKLKSPNPILLHGVTASGKTEVYFKLIKDVIDRKKISDELILKSVANYVLDNIGNILSTNNVANTMTSNGRNINVRIALKYIEGLIESFFFYRANRYDIKGKQYLKTCE